jgi:hypothetical protein
MLFIGSPLDKQCRDLGLGQEIVQTGNWPLYVQTASTYHDPLGKYRNMDVSRNPPALYFVNGQYWIGIDYRSLLSSA